MSEVPKSRKRSRKAKLEVRDDAEIEQVDISSNTESAILQENPTVEILPEILITHSSYSDHTYSLQHCVESVTVPHLSIKVEVEEFDESLITVNNEESIRTDCPEPVVANDVPTRPQIELSTKSDNKTTNEINTPIIDHTKPIKNKRIRSNTYSRNKSRIRVFYVDIEKMYKISDHIAWSSDNPADKYLNVELKNRWGRVLRSVDMDLHDELIQNVLNTWSTDQLGLRNWKEIPLFYQCRICKLAWWYLAPFREHIRIHDPHTLLVYHLDVCQETIIVANTERTTDIVYIKCEGSCLRCGFDYDVHVKMNNNQYRCSECSKLVTCCKTVQQHNPICMNMRREKYNESMKLKCDICSDVFISLEHLRGHTERMHLVRSDVPIPVVFRHCAACASKYHHYPSHMCMKSSMNSVCLYCQRKFPSKMFATVHMIIEGVDSKCKICDSPLLHRCEEPLHVLTHSENYRLVFKCVNLNCVPTMCFTDEMSAKVHKIVFHGQRHDRRRAFFETVLVPKQCVKSEVVSDLDHFLACNSYFDEKQKTALLEPSSEKIEEQQTDIIQKDTETNSQDDQIMDIDSDIESEIKQAEEENDIDTEDSETGYEDILSKMFNVHEPKKQSKNVSDTPTNKVSEVSQDTIHEKWSKTVQKSIVSRSKQTQEKLNKKHTRKSKKQNTVQVSDTAVISTRVSDMSDTDTVLPKKLKSSDTNQTPEETVTVSHRVETPVESVTVSDRVETPSENVSLSNYEETLSKVFRVSDSFAKSFVDIQDSEIKVKKEVEELSFEELIDTQENPITIKEEPLDIEYNDQIIDNCNSSQSPSHEYDFDIQHFKIESNECDIDISAVKIEPQHFKQELEEATDMTIIEPSKENVQKQTESNQNSDVNIEIVRSKIKIECTDDGYEDKSKKNVTPKYKYKGKRKVYFCTKCGYSNYHKLYQIHVKSKCELTPHKDDINKHKCTKCSSSFDSLKSYLLHFESHGYEELHCPECYLKFDDLKELIPHFHKHVRFNYVNCWMIDKNMVQRENKNRCQICHENVKPANFFSHWEMHLRLRTNDDPEIPPVSINTSGRRNANKKTLPPDVLNAALEQLRAISSDKVCNVCNRMFTRRTDIKRHIIEHLLLDAYSKKENTPDSTFVCQLCSARHRTSDRYKFHMRSHGALPVYRCERCDKTFSDSSNFAKHKKTHSMKVMICDICHKKFHAKTSMEKHMMMHRVTEPIKCNLCPKEFYAMSHFNKHMQTRHERLTRFRCVLCDVWFDSLRRKWDHLWDVHRERKYVADCPLCRRQYRKCADVKAHAQKEHNLEVKYYKPRPDQRISMLRTKVIQPGNKKEKDVLLVPCILTNNL